MEPEWGPARPPAASRVWGRIVPPLAVRLRESAPEISVAMMERIGAVLPELVADPADMETNRASNEANVIAIAGLLERGADPRKVELPAPTLAYAQAGAHRNTPMAGLLRAYRIGHAYAWERILALLRAEADDAAELAIAVELVSAWLHEYIDAVICLGEDVYTRERERWLRTSAALQAETIKAILEGAPTDPATASARLGYELDRHHLALVAWLDSGEQVADPVTAVESALRRLMDDAGLARPLILSTGLISVAAWIGSREAIDSAALTASATGVDPRVRIAMGDPGRGIEGFRRSHQEAMEARRVAILSGRPPGSVTVYPEIALIAIATADLDQARNFVAARLGPLATDDQTSRRLVETLRAYLDHGASHGRAAHQLGIHENTVRYRVRQAEDLLERPIGPSDLAFRVALTLADVDAG